MKTINEGGNKVLELEALDGSRWQVPLSVLKDRYADYLRILPEFSYVIREETLRHIDRKWSEDTTGVISWAKGCDWAHIKSYAVQVKGPDPLDMQDSWLNGKMRVIEDVPPAPDTGADSITIDAPEGITISAPETRIAVDMAEAERLTGGRYVPGEDYGRLTIPADALAAAKTLHFHHVDNCWSVAISDDGKVTLGEGVTLDEGTRAFWAGVEHSGLLPAPARAAQALSRAEMIAVYDAMKSEDILKDVQPGDHGNAILEAYGRRVITAAIEKAQAGTAA